MISDRGKRVHIALFESAPVKCRSTIALGVGAAEFMAWKRHLGEKSDANSDTKTTQSHGRCTSTTLTRILMKSPRMSTRNYQKCCALRPNPSLNLTLCGGPISGSKSLAQNRPTAKCRLAQTLGVNNSVLHSSDATMKN